MRTSALTKAEVFFVKAGLSRVTNPEPDHDIFHVTAGQGWPNDWGGQSRSNLMFSKVGRCN
jgi:hypothetical protein